MRTKVAKPSIQKLVYALFIASCPTFALAQNVDSVLARALNTVQNITSSLGSVSTTTTLIVDDIRMQVGTPRPPVMDAPAVPDLPDMPGLNRAVPLTPRVPPVPGVAPVQSVPRVDPVPPVSRTTRLVQTIQSDTATDLVDTLASIDPIVAGQIETSPDLAPLPDATLVTD